MKMAEAQGWGCWEVGVLAGGCCSRKEYSWAKSWSRVGGRCASSHSVGRGFSGVPGEGPNLLTDSGSSCFLVKPVSLCGFMGLLCCGPLHRWVPAPASACSEQ